MKFFWWVFKQNMLIMLYLFGVFTFMLFIDKGTLWSYLYASLSVIVFFIYTGSDVIIFELSCYRYSCYPLSLEQMCSLSRTDGVSKYFPFCWLICALSNTDVNIKSLYSIFECIKQSIYKGYVIIKTYQCVSIAAVAICTFIAIMSDNIDMFCLIPLVFLSYVFTDVVLQSIIIFIFLKKYESTTK